MNHQSKPESRAWVIQTLIRRPFTLLVILLICGLSLTIYFRYVHLSRYKTFITEEFAEEIAAIEDAARKWPEDRYKNDATFFSSEEILSDMQETFDGSEFHSASWSYDGHHGLKGLISMPDGFRTSPIFTVTDHSGQSLNYGTTFGGEPLLVFQKWIRGPQAVHHLKVVFNRSEIDTRMASGNSDSEEDE